MRTNKRIDLLLIVIAVLLAFLAAASISLAAPMSTVTVVTTGCRQTLNRNYVFYSGRFSFLMWNWGFIATNMDTGQAHWRNGIGKPDAPGQCGSCSSSVVIVGDCWQSVSWLTVTPGAPKWVVAVGAPDMCNDTHDESVSGLAVWKFNSSYSTFQWAGLYRYRDTIRDAPAYLDGDFAYQQQWDRRTTGRCPSSSGLAKRWEKINLNTLTGAGYFCEVPASAQVVQTNIDGYTYTATEQHPTPKPYCALGATQFTLLRSGVVLPTDTPVATAPPGSTPTRTATAAPGTPTRTPTIPCDTFPGGPICTPTPGGPTKTRTPSKTPTTGPPPPTATPWTGCCDPNTMPCPAGVPICTPTPNVQTATRTSTPTVSFTPVVTTTPSASPKPTFTPTPAPVSPTCPPCPTNPPTITVAPRPTPSSSGGCGNKQAGLLTALPFAYGAWIARRRRKP